MAVVAEDAQGALDALTRACLRTLSDQADARRLATPEAREAAQAITSSLLRQACNAIGDPLLARRVFERHVAVIDAMVLSIAQEQDDDRA